MKKLTQPWKLRRSFGSQPVGCVAGSPRPEAGIAARVIPAQSSGRTFRGPSDADLPTLVVDVHRCANPHTLVRRNYGVTSTFNRNVAELASSRASRTRHASPQKHWQPSERLMQCHRSASLFTHQHFN